MKTHPALRSALALLALTTAQAVRADDAITLARTFKVGDTTRVHSVISFEVMGASIVATQNTKREIKEIKSNGDIVSVESHESGGTVSVNGQEQPQPEITATTTETFDKYGKLVDYKAPEGVASLTSPEVQHLMSLFTNQIFPDKPVKVGDTWQSEQDNPAVKGKKVVVKLSYLGTEKVDGMDLWKLHETSEADTDDQGGKLKLDSTAWLDPTNGHPVKSEATIKGLPLEQLGPVDVTIKSSVIKPGDDKKKGG